MMGLKLCGRLNMVFAQARETGLIKSEAKKVKTLHLAMAEFESAISDGKEIVCSF